MYTGMRIDSAEALRIGLVDRVVPDSELWNATMEIARTISGNAPLAIKAAKITIAQVLKDPGDRDMDAIKADRHRLHGLARIFARAAAPSWKSASRNFTGGNGSTLKSPKTVKQLSHAQACRNLRQYRPQPQAPRLPLSRFKVIDLTLARAGPSCVRTLADWGADVIRVEPPPADGEIDELVGRRDGSDFQNLHRNKRAITLNLKTDEGREILMRLAEKADVVIENMRPGVTKRLGVDYRVGQKAQSAHRLWQHFRLRPVRPLRLAALDRPDRAGHVRHHVGDGDSRPGPGPGRRRRHRHHGRRLPRAGRADRAARSRGVAAKAAGCRPR